MNPFFSFIEEVGKITRFSSGFFKWVTVKPFRWRHFIEILQFIGVESIPIILLVSLFTGAVFALQTGYAFRLFNAETLVGATVALSLTREIAPVFASLMVIARVGSSMAAEIGSMRVTEQVDALEAMAVNPYHYLVVPRILGCMAMVPLLTVVFNVVGFMGAYLVGVGLLGIPEGPFMIRVSQMVEQKDLFSGLFKALVFGFLIAVVCCYQGYKTTGGATGVGRSTTRAVVTSSVLILIVDYFLTQWILEILKNR